MKPGPSLYCVLLELRRPKILARTREVSWATSKGANVMSELKAKPFPSFRDWFFLITAAVFNLGLGFENRLRCLGTTLATMAMARATVLTVKKVNEADRLLTMRSRSEIRITRYVSSSSSFIYFRVFWFLCRLLRIEIHLMECGFMICFWKRLMMFIVTHDLTASFNLCFSWLEWILLIIQSMDIKLFCGSSTVPLDFT